MSQLSREKHAFAALCIIMTSLNDTFITIIAIHRERQSVMYVIRCVKNICKWNSKKQNANKDFFKKFGTTVSVKICDSKFNENTEFYETSTWTSFWVFNLNQGFKGEAAFIFNFYWHIVQ